MVLTFETPILLILTISFPLLFHWIPIEPFPISILATYSKEEDVADVGTLPLLHHSVGEWVDGFVSVCFIYFQGSYRDVLLFYRDCRR